MKLDGFVGTPVTPMNTDGSIDWPGVEKVINFLIAAGADAIAVPMHIGESLNLTIEERQQLARVAVKVVGGRVPLIINCSLPGTDQTVELAKDAKAAGANAVVVTAPYFWQPSQKELLRHFASVAEKAEIPFLAYNFPARLNVEIKYETFITMLDTLPLFVGIKDAGGKMSFISRACAAVAERKRQFSYFVGVEYLLTSVPAGACGTFSPCGPVAPRLVKALLSACRDKRFDEALPMQDRLLRLFEVLQTGYPGTIKYAQELLGRPVGTTRPPLGPLTDEDRAYVKKELGQLKIFDTEPVGWTGR